MSGGGVVIFGGRGMLGTDVALCCELAGIEAETLDLPEFDITDAEQVAGAVAGKRVVVNCAAYTNVEKAEAEYELAHRVNAEAVGRAGQAAKKAGASFLYVSTDFVFDGQKDGAYDEADEVNPISAYGKSKLAGEVLLAESGCRSCIVRVQWTYGAAGNNFVKKILARAQSGQPLKVVDDQVGSPTATVEAAAAIVELLRMNELPEGTFHFAAAGYVSRYEMAGFMLDTLGMDVPLAACKTSEFPTAAKRPLNSRFDCGKIQKLLSKPIRPWEAALREFLEKDV